MDHEAVLARYDQLMRRDAGADGPGARIERDGCVVRHVGVDGDDWNGVVWSALNEVTADAAITAQIARFSTLGRAFEWKAYAHDLPADLHGRLCTAGFMPEPEEALMVAEVPGLSTDIELPDDIRLHTVTGPAGVDLVAEVHDRVFGVGGAGLRSSLKSRLAQSPETVGMVVAMAGEVPVSAARMEMHPGAEFAGLWGGGTLAAWRGRGIYRALVAYRARIAAQRGYRYLQVDASDDSRPILERLGFHRLSTTTPYVYRLQGGEGHG